MRAFKAFFLSRLLREKILLTVFTALAALMWLSNFSRRANRAWSAHRVTTLELADQKQWLANRGAIEAAALKAVKDLDPGRTFDDTRLVGELSGLARDNSIRFTNDTPRTERSGQFAVHTVQFNLPKTDWDALVKFYGLLAQRSPYIGIEQFSLAADLANPAQLNASLRVSSVEILR
jgi:hypothetical protein